MTTSPSVNPEADKKRRSNKAALWMLALCLAVVALPDDWVTAMLVRFSPSARWAQCYDQGRTLVDSEQYAEAEKQLEAALRIADDSFPFPDSRTANTLCHLGVAYYVQRKLADAEKVFLRSVELIPDAFLPVDVPKLLDTSLDYLGETYCLQERFEGGIKVNERVLSIREEMLGPNSAGVADTLFKLGVDSYLTQDSTQFDAAEGYLLRCLEIREQELAPDDSQITETKYWLNELYKAQYEFGKALELAN